MIYIFCLIILTLFSSTKPQYHQRSRTEQIQKLKDNFANLNQSSYRDAVLHGALSETELFVEQLAIEQKYHLFKLDLCKMSSEYIGGSAENVRTFFKSVKQYLQQNKDIYAIIFISHIDLFYKSFLYSASVSSEEHSMVNSIKWEQVFLKDEKGLQRRIRFVYAIEGDMDLFWYMEFRGVSDIAEFNDSQPQQSSKIKRRLF